MRVDKRIFNGFLYPFSCMDGRSLIKDLDVCLCSFWKIANLFVVLGRIKLNIFISAPGNFYRWLLRYYSFTERRTITEYCTKLKRDNLKAVLVVSERMNADCVHYIPYQNGK